jgi:hypothetical protein
MLLVLYHIVAFCMRSSSEIVVLWGVLLNMVFPDGALDGAKNK